MEEREKIMGTFVRLLNEYHELRNQHGIDAQVTEWARAELSGARILLETTFGDNERELVFREVRRRSGKGIPHRGRDWTGWDSEAQRER